MKKVKVAFLDTDKIDIKERKKVKKFNTSGPKTSCVPLKNSEGIKSGRGSRWREKKLEVERI